MDPVSLVVAALTAGAAAGLSSAASSAVTDAYAQLQRLAAARLRTWRPGSERVLDRPWEPTQEAEDGLRSLLTDAGAADDWVLVSSAQELLGLVRPVATASRGLPVDLRGASGIQVGDHNVQHNIFPSPGELRRQ